MELERQASHPITGWLTGSGSREGQRAASSTTPLVSARLLACTRVDGAAASSTVNGAVSTSTLPPRASSAAVAVPPTLPGGDAGENDDDLDDDLSGAGGFPTTAPSAAPSSAFEELAAQLSHPSLGPALGVEVLSHAHLVAAIGGLLPPQWRGATVVSCGGSDPTPAVSGNTSVNTSRGPSLEWVASFWRVAVSFSDREAVEAFADWPLIPLELLPLDMSAGVSASAVVSSTVAAATTSSSPPPPTTGLASADAVAPSSACDPPVLLLSCGLAHAALVVLPTRVGVAALLIPAATRAEGVGNSSSDSVPESTVPSSRVLTSLTSSSSLTASVTTASSDVTSPSSTDSVGVASSSAAAPASSFYGADPIGTPLHALLLRLRAPLLRCSALPPHDVPARLSNDRLVPAVLRALTDVAYEVMGRAVEGEVGRIPSTTSTTNIAVVAVAAGTAAVGSASTATIDWGDARAGISSSASAVAAQPSLYGGGDISGSATAAGTSSSSAVVSPGDRERVLRLVVAHARRYGPLSRSELAQLSRLPLFLTVQGGYSPLAGGNAYFLDDSGAAAASSTAAATATGDVAATSSALPTAAAGVGGVTAAGGGLRGGIAQEAVVAQIIDASNDLRAAMSLARPQQQQPMLSVPAPPSLSHSSSLSAATTASATTTSSTAPRDHFLVRSAEFSALHEELGVAPLSEAQLLLRYVLPRVGTQPSLSPPPSSTETAGPSIAGGGAGVGAVAHLQPGELLTLMGAIRDRWHRLRSTAALVAAVREIVSEGSLRAVLMMCSRVE